MALKEYQVELATDTLYEVTLRGGVSGRGGAANASIWSNDAISIYGPESATQPVSLAVMVLESENTSVTGYSVLSKAVSVVPRYIAITGSATEIVASGIEVTNLGAIA